MNRPTPEDFAKAPLFRSYLVEELANPPQVSTEKAVVNGFEIERADVEQGGFRFTVEGVQVLDVMPRSEFGQAVWIGTFFNGKEYRVYEVDKELAGSEFGGQVRDLVTKRGDDLVFHMESHGVDIGPELDSRLEDDEEEDDHHERTVAIVWRYGEPVRIVREGFMAWIEGQDTSRPWGEIRANYTRAGENGEAICPAETPLLRQLQIMEFAEGAERHREDLKSLRQLVGDPSLIADEGLRKNVHMFDIVDSELKDPEVPQAAILTHRDAIYDGMNGEEGAPDAAAVAVMDPTAPVAPRQAERPIEEAMKDATGFEVGTFYELRSMPDYQREQIRATVRPLFKEIFGEDFPMERVVVGRPARDPEAYAAFMFFFRDGELVKDVGPITFPHMPGYQTSHAEVRRRDGWDTLVFSDPFGTYAYGVPTPDLTMDAEIDAQGERDDNDTDTNPAP